MLSILCTLALAGSGEGVLPGVELRSTPTGATFPLVADLPVRPAEPGEVACPARLALVDGAPRWDVRCEGRTGAAVREATARWTTTVTVGGTALLVWTREGKPTALLVPPALHASELPLTVAPSAPTGLIRERCAVRTIIDAEGTPVAAFADLDCPVGPRAEALATAARWTPPGTATQLTLHVLADGPPAAP